MRNVTLYWRLILASYNNQTRAVAGQVIKIHTIFSKSFMFPYHAAGVGPLIPQLLNSW